jgi:hypothetical protein
VATEQDERPIARQVERGANARSIDSRPELVGVDPRRHDTNPISLNAVDPYEVLSDLCAVHVEPDDPQVPNSPTLEPRTDDVVRMARLRESPTGRIGAASPRLAPSNTGEMEHVRLPSAGQPRVHDVEWLTCHLPCSRRGEGPELPH